MAKSDGYHNQTVIANPKVHPVLEAGVTLTKILILITAGIVFMISLQAGAEWYDVAIRTSLTIILVGLLGWYINWMLGKWIISYEMNKMQKEDAHILDEKI
jgi:hypothetical protein